MYRPLCLSALGVLLLFHLVSTPQRPNDAQEALAQLARVDGRVKFDGQGKVVDIDI